MTMTPFDKRVRFFAQRIYAAERQHLQQRVRSGNGFSRNRERFRSPVAIYWAVEAIKKRCQKQGRRP